MKIGDRIFVRGYIDEIRKDTVIVRNDGGYFGTILSEVTGELPSVQPEPCEDAVSRHRLLNDLEELTTAWEKYPVMAEQIKGVEVAIGYVKSIPSVQPETHEERTETHACDLISRAMLLEYIHNEPVGKMLCDKYNLDGVIKQLPSAQPEVIHCRECRHHHYESKDIPYCDRIDYGYGWKDNDFCSKGKRRTE